MCTKLLSTWHDKKQWYAKQQVDILISKTEPGIANIIP